MAQTIRVVLAVVIAATTLMTAAPEASACSLEQSFPLRIADLVGGDPADPLAHLEDDYRTWLQDNVSAEERIGRPQELPVLLGVWYERTIVAVDPVEETWIGSGGVTVVDAAWGQPPDDLGPREWPVDLTSCADIFPLPVPGQFNLILDDRRIGLDLRQLSAPDEFEDSKAILSELFGAPVEPERQPDREDLLFRGVWSSARIEQVGDLSVRPLDSLVEFVPPGASPAPTPTPGTVVDEAPEATQPQDPEPVDETASPEVDGASGGIGFPWIIVPMVIVALGLGMWFALRRPKRTFSDLRRRRR